MSKHEKTLPKPSILSFDQFMASFAGIYEHSAWVAQNTHATAHATMKSTQLDTLDGLANAMASAMEQASKAEKLTLIRAHPDLAGKAAAAGTLTQESNDEQSSAGLDQCTPEELGKFHELNDAYKAKFDFPFIMAVKGSNRHLILAAFEQRIQNSPNAEFETALGEINKIARLRLQSYFPANAL